MGMLFRIVFSSLVIVSFTIIVSLSFFSEPKYFSFPEIPQNFKQEISKLEIEESIIYKQQYNAFDTLYTSADTVSFDGKGVDISESGKYLSSFRNIGIDYNFIGSGYRILQEGVGEVFIDTSSSPGKVFVMPLNTSLEVQLLSPDGNETYTSIFLMPHMYLEFHPARGKFLKNADTVRVETVYKLGYVGQNIGAMSENDFFMKYNSEGNNFFQEVVGIIQQNDILSYSTLEGIKAQEVGRIPGYDWVQRYLHLFVNEEKKKIFYKNMILDNTLELLSLQEYDKGHISRIQKDMEILKSIDEASYNEILHIFEYFQSLVYSSYQKEYLTAKLHFASLRYPDIPESDWSFPLNGFTLFSGYDSANDFSSDISEEFLKSFHLFVKSGNNTETHSILRYQYFAYFLEKQLEFFLDTPTRVKNLSFINNTLKNYIEVSSFSYNSGVTEKITALYVYNEILKKIDSFLRNEGFLTNRTPEGILEFNPNNTISSQEVGGLKKQVDIVLDTYEKHKDYLSTTNTRDQSIKNEIEVSRLHLTEYFDAFENYELYVSKYDISKKDLLSIDTYFFNDDIVINKDAAQKYLSQFVGISFSGIQIEIVDEIYYQISNMYVAGKNFSFDLYPYESYKMENIVVDGKELSFVYKLGQKKQSWDEKYRTAGMEERDKYDFSRFFIITFFTNDEQNVEIYVDDNTRYNEDKSELIFKRDKLLGSKGEFSTLKDVLFVEYDDIRLEKNDTLYDIYLENMDVSIDLGLENDTEKTKLEMNAEYVLSENDHYFDKVKFKILQNVASGDKIYEFGGNNFYVTGKIHISEFSSTLQEILVDFPIYNSIYGILASIYPNINISVEHTIRNKKTSFKFDSDGKSYNILLTGSMVDAIYKGTQKLTSQPIKIQDISDYLK